MPRPKKTVPSYSLHKPSGQARVRVNGRDVYLGQYGSEASRREYARVLAEVAASPAPPAVAARCAVSVNEVLFAFLAHAQAHYRRPDGTPTNELKEYKLALRQLRVLYGHAPAREFGPIALQAVRRWMIEAGWCRKRVNKQVGRVKRVFRRAVGQELAPVDVIQSLVCVDGLQKGRTDARETDPVEPVPVGDGVATLPHLWPTVGAMVELKRLTGMRPGEARLLRLCDVDRAGDPWVYCTGAHTTAHAPWSRSISLGPRARAALVAFLRGEVPPPGGVAHLDLAECTARLAAAGAYERTGRMRDAELLRDTARPVVRVAGCVVDPAAYLFSPARAREERFALWRKARKSKVPPSQMNRRKPTGALALHMVCSVSWGRRDPSASPSP